MDDGYHYMFLVLEHSLLAVASCDEHQEPLIVQKHDLEWHVDSKEKSHMT